MNRFVRPGDRGGVVLDAVGRAVSNVLAMDTRSPHISYTTPQGLVHEDILDILCKMGQLAARFEVLHTLVV